jgi:lipopolysaccharide export system permease protein
VNHVSRYILRQLLGPFAFTTVALAAVVWLTQSLTFVDMIINRSLSAASFVYLLLLLTPGFLLLILPIALFTTIVYTYHRLTYDSEIVVMRAAGLSPNSLAVPAMVLAGVITVLGYLVSLYLMPLGFRTFKDVQFVIRTNQAALLLQDGEFNAIGKGVTAFIRERGANGELLGILVHDQRDPYAPVTLMAERGLLLAGETGRPRFVLFEGNRQELQTKQQQVSLLYFERYALDLDILGEPPGARWHEPAERFLPTLLWPEDNRNDRAYANELRAEGHNRLAAPLYALVLAAVAIAALLSGEFNRRGEWGRIIVASGAAVLIEAAGLGLRSVIVRRPELTPLLYFVPVVALFIGLFLLRVRRWPQPNLTWPHIWRAA